MSTRIALAGNPNSGKTTLFNALTGSNQYVGNWPGVTVEKKEGILKGDKSVTIVDLPGIYSLSPYTLEEVVSRDFLIDEKPDGILNIIDGTNLERNLYLTTQLLEMGIPMVVAVNMMDVVENSGDKINTKQLSKELGCPVYEISALKGTGVKEAAQAAVSTALSGECVSAGRFSGSVEHALAHIEEKLLSGMPQTKQKWYALKLFERDEKIAEKLKLSDGDLSSIQPVIKACEEELDDDSESIITTERYEYISSIINDCCKIKNKGQLTLSDKIDKVVTNRFLALPIFALVMTLVFYVSVTTVGGFATDWTNDGLFGDGWHLFGIGSTEFEESAEAFDVAQAKIDAFLTQAEAKGIDTQPIASAFESGEMDADVLEQFEQQAADANIVAVANMEDENGEITESFNVDTESFKQATAVSEPEPSDYGIWVPGIPVVAESILVALNCADWLQSLILYGIIGGVGAVLGFVPQILILFIFLAFLEGTGYMARVAFIMDRVFRRFGLSGKSFIPMLIGVGCGVPGIMASRTIESDRDRKMTIMTTTFIPCSAKLPIIALISGALFSRAWWVAPSAYFIGIAAIVCSGIILKKTKMFAGDVAPFVMELPSYHMPTVRYILGSMWERGWSFIKKAGTVILLSTVFIWFTSSFGFANGNFGMVEMPDSLLAGIGGGIAWIFAPLGFGDWKSAVAAVTGLVAKENVVGTLGVLFGNADVTENGKEIWHLLAAQYTAVSAYSFLVFNLLCAPCFAAMGAIKREMNNTKWFWFAVGYQTIFAYAVSLCVYQFGSLLTGSGFGIGSIAAFIILGIFLWLMFRKPAGQNQKIGLKIKGAKT